MKLLWLLLISVNICLIQAFGSYQDIPIVHFKRDYQVAPQGRNFELNCPISGQPAPIITWFKGSEEIKDYEWTRFSLDKKSLKISQVDYEDTGIYVCKGTNGYGSSEVRIDFFVIAEDSFANWSPSDGIAPILTEDTRRLEETFYVQSGADLDLSCSALGQPKPRISWKKNMVKFNVKDKGLTLRKVSKKDEGVYTCRASNEHGDVTKSFVIHVNEPLVQVNQPKTGINQEPASKSSSDLPSYSSIQHLIVPNDPANTTVEENGKAILECRAQGKSTWLKKLGKGENSFYPDNETITLDTDTFLVIKESKAKQIIHLMDESRNDYFVSRLIIDKVTSSDAGMYICVVQPSQGRTSFKYAYLKVKNAEKSNNTEDKLIIIVACLGALILVFLILLITFMLRKNSNKPNHHQNPDANESRERMLTSSDQACKMHPNVVQVPVSQIQEYFAPVWTSPSTLNPKQGLPLPPTPVEHHHGHQSPQVRHTLRQHHHHHQHHRR